MARGFVPALINPFKEMNIFKTLLRIKEHDELRAALEELAKGFEYDSQYARHNQYIESEPDPRRSAGPFFFGPTQDFSPINPDYSIPSQENNSFSGFGGGDFGGGGSGGDW